MEKPLKLMGRATSINVQKVAWVIAELNLPCNRVDAGGVFGGVDTPDYIALNPNKRVPTLIDGDLVLWESNAICRYLVDKYSSNGVLKADTADSRARADMWMEWFQSTVYSDFISLFYQTVRLPPSERDPAKKDNAIASLTSALTIFDEALSDRMFINGDEPSLGDIPTGSFLYRYYTIDIKRPDLRNLARYYTNLTKRRPYQDHVMIDYSSLRGSD